MWKNSGTNLENPSDERTVGKWFISGHKYPCFLAKDYVVSLFEKHGFALVKSFTNRYGQGHSLYMVFNRNGVIGED